MHNQYILIYKFESIFIILFSRKFFDIFGIVKIPVVFQNFCLSRCWFHQNSNMTQQISKKFSSHVSDIQFREQVNCSDTIPL